VPVLIDKANSGNQEAPDRSNYRRQKSMCIYAPSKGVGLFGTVSLAVALGLGHTDTIVAQQIPYQTDYQAAEAGDKPEDVSYLKIKITGSTFGFLELYSKDKSEEVCRQALPPAFTGNIPARLFFPTSLDSSAWTFAATSGDEPDRLIAFVMRQTADATKQRQPCPGLSPASRPFPAKALSVQWVTGTVARISPLCNADEALIIRYRLGTGHEGWERYDLEAGQWQSWADDRPFAAMPGAAVCRNPLWQTEYRVGDEPEDLKVYLSGCPSPKIVEMFYGNEFFRAKLAQPINLDMPPNVFPAPKVKNNDAQAVVIRYGARSERAVAYICRKNFPMPTQSKDLELPAWGGRPVSVEWVTNYIAKISVFDDSQQSRIIRYKPREQKWEMFQPNSWEPWNR
jgi:hypothetical protein